MFVLQFKTLPSIEGQTRPAHLRSARASVNSGCGLDELSVMLIPGERVRQLGPQGPNPGHQHVVFRVVQARRQR